MQNPTNDCTEEEGFYRNFYEIVDWSDFNPSDSDSEGQTKNEQSEKEAFESPGHDKSSHEIVSPNDFQNEDTEKIRIVEAHSITEEAFKNLGDENHMQDMSVFDFVNESILQNFVQEEGADSIDQNDQNTVLYLTTMQNP